MRITRLLATAAAAVVGTATLTAAAASASAAPPVVRVGPNQFFAGLVNGSSGPAVIRTDCFGPTALGRMGHPLPGQTLEVEYLGTVPPPTPTSAGDVGFTGPSSSEIGAFFGSLPPAPTPPVSATIFTVYGASQPLPTSVLVPCFGQGSVPFTPIPGAGGKEAVVPVTFEGQP
jgi:hypothetical protein